MPLHPLNVSGSYFYPGVNKPTLKQRSKIFVVPWLSATFFASMSIDASQFSNVSVQVSGAWNAGDLEVFVGDFDTDLSDPDQSNYTPLSTSAGAVVALTPNAFATYAFVGDEAEALKSAKLILFRSTVEQEDTSIVVVIKD